MLLISLKHLLNLMYLKYAHGTKLINIHYDKYKCIIEKTKIYE